MMITRTARHLGDARRLARVLVLAAALAPATIAAQVPAQGPNQPEERIEGPSYGRVTLLFAQVYDDNIFAVPDSLRPESDLVARFGPTFEVGRNTRRLQLVARYGMAAERFFERYDLNSDIARQDGNVDMRYHVTPRTQLRADGGYIDTQSPRELNTATLLASGRTRAERWSAHAGLAQSLTRLTTFNVDYNLFNDTIAEHLSNLSHAGRIGLAWQKSTRTTLRADYRPRYVEFGTVSGQVPVTPPVQTVTEIRGGRQTTQAVTGGFTYALSPLTSVEFDGGPRFSEGPTRPEIAATVRRRMQRGGELSASYLSTQETSFGEVAVGELSVLEAGFYDVQRVSGIASITPTRHLTMTAMPAFARSSRLGRYSDVREVSVDITVRVLRRLSFIASGRVGNQEGTFNTANDPIRTRILSLTSQLTLP